MLAQCHLAAGDRISMKYKFGNENMIVFNIISVDRGQALLPELLFKNHTTRAHIDASGGDLNIRHTLCDEHVDILVRARRRERGSMGNYFISMSCSADEGGEEASEQSEEDDDDDDDYR